MLRPHEASGKARSLVYFFVMLLSACSDSPEAGAPGADHASTTPDPATRISMLEHPAADGSGEGSLLELESDLLFSWIESAVDTTYLKMGRLTNGQWSEPVTIASGQDWFVNWADFPALAASSDGRLSAHWLAREGESTYAYGIRLSSSSDGGANWSQALSPHRDGTLSEHGFVSYFPLADGRQGVVWLDGRHTGGGEGHGGAMSLRAVLVDANGMLSGEAELDSRTCDCCQTDAAATDRGAVVVYRDRSEDERRDIGIVRLVDGLWQTPELVAEDGWEISACPVNGPAVVATGKQLAVAWFTMAGGQPAVKLASSADVGESFAAPLRIDAGNPLGRVDLAALDDGSVVVSWLENRGDDAVVHLSRLQGQELIETIEVGQTHPARSSGFPRLAASGGTVWVVWRQVDEQSKTLRLAQVDFAEL
jgi:hypothetical protein